MATGGGFTTHGQAGTLDVYEARPDDPPTVEGEDGPGIPSLPVSYRVWAVNDSGAEGDLQAWVICLDVAG